MSRLRVWVRTTCGLMVGLLTAGCGGQPEPAVTPAATPQSAAPAVAVPDAAKGETLVKAMSGLLGGAQNFTFATDEVHLRGDANDKLIERKFSRTLAVRRPDAAWYRAHGDREIELWFSDKQLTLVADADKIWSQVEVPATLDEAMDDVATRFDVQLPMADLMYSSPWDALMSAESKGGHVGVETIGGRQCHHVAYSQSVVDWDLWVEDGEKPLPCQLTITYKQQPGPPRSTMTFRDWNLAANSPAERFVPVIPKDYEKVGMIERVPATNDAADAAAAGDTAAVDTAAPAAAETPGDGTGTQPDHK